MKMKGVITGSAIAILIVVVTLLCVYAYTLQIRIAYLEDVKETLETNLSSVNASVMQLRARAQVLESDVTSHETMILELQTKIDSLNASLVECLLNCSKTEILLRKDAIYWQPGNVTLYIRNTGISDGEISAVYLGTSAGNLEEQTATFDPTTKIVEREGGSTLEIYITYSWTTKETYHFRVAPTVGESLYFQETAP